VAAAAGDHDALDGFLADQTRFAFATVHAMLKLKVTFFAIGIHIIRDRGTASRDGFVQHFFHGGMQAGELFATDVAGAPAWTNTGAEESLIRVNVSDAAQQFLI
jgi:hypothetical protein